MGETNRLKTLKYRGAIIAACAALVAGTWACGDDSSTPEEAGTEDSSTPDSSTVDAPKDNSVADVHEASVDAHPDADAATEAGDAAHDGDATANDADARSEAGNDAGDARSEASDGSADGDATVTDAGHEAGPDAPAEAEGGMDSGVEPLEMCLAFDDDYNAFVGSGPTDASACPMQTDPNNPACPDRVNGWSDMIQQDFFLTGPILNDCRINGMFVDLMNDPTQIPNYQAQLDGWSLDLFGCPVTGSDAGTNSYQLMPFTPSADPSMHVYTTADLDLISSYYVSGVEQALSDMGAPSLTQQQIDQINANLALRQLNVPQVVTSSVYSFDSCPPDAGSDAPTDAPDGG